MKARIAIAVSFITVLAVASACAQATPIRRVTKPSKFMVDEKEMPDEVMLSSTAARRAGNLLSDGCVAPGGVAVNSALAQSFPPNMPNLPPGIPMPNMDNSRQRPSRRHANDPSQVRPPGVPVPLDSPLFKSFQKLDQQSVYHVRMTMVTSDPQMAQMMEQMGFAPTETTVAGGTRQVSIHMKMPATDVPGQVDDWEFRAVSRNGRSARLITSPAVPRLLKLSDAMLAQQMAQQDQQASRAIAASLAQGPMGAINAAMIGGVTATAHVEAVKLRQKAHDFYSWQCQPASGEEPVNRNAPPPLTDLRVVGDQVLDGIPVTTYEFYVLDNGEFHGPMHMHVAKDTGLPVRIEMSDPQMGGGMRMDYYDFNKGGDIEVPACLSESK
jgi:hypothetical protein